MGCGSTPTKLVVETTSCCDSNKQERLKKNVSKGVISLLNYIVIIHILTYMCKQSKEYERLRRERETNIIERNRGTEVSMLT